MILINQAKWLRNRWARTAKAPIAMATPYGTSGFALGWPSASTCQAGQRLCASITTGASPRNSNNRGSASAITGFPFTIAFVMP